MNDFRAALDGFCESMREEGRRSAPPALKAMLERGRAAKRTRLRRAVAAAAVMLALAAIPVYQREQRDRDAAQAKADALLMEQVNEGLGRPVPRAMAPLLEPVLVPVSSTGPARRSLDSESRPDSPRQAPLCCKVPRRAENVCRVGTRPC